MEILQQLGLAHTETPTSYVVSDSAFALGFGDSENLTSYFPSHLLFYLEVPLILLLVAWLSVSFLVSDFPHRFRPKSVISSFSSTLQSPNAPIFSRSVSTAHLDDRLHLLRFSFAPLHNGRPDRTIISTKLVRDECSGKEGDQ